MTPSPAPPTPECKRCGQCCHGLDKQGEVYVCRFLVKLDDFRKPTACSVYSMRKSFNPHPMYEDKCIDRKDQVVDYPGCPFNTGKPLFPAALPVH